MDIPKGHEVVMPYLILAGTKKFIDFTTIVFKAELTFSRMREDNETLMHAEIMIAGSTIMFTEATAQWKVQTSNLFLYVENADKTFQLALDNGATVVMELSNQDYGRTCGVADPCGNVWWITSVHNS